MSNVMDSRGRGFVEKKVNERPSGHGSRAGNGGSLPPQRGDQRLDLLRVPDPAAVRQAGKDAGRLERRNVGGSALP